MTSPQDETYRYSSAEPAHTSGYLWSPVVDFLRAHGVAKVLDLGCGNGAFSAHLAELGFDVVGCDASTDGIRLARAACDRVRYHQISVYDDPAAIGQTEFDAVVALEVIEHLVAPRALLRFARALLRPSGHLVITTPYHGYLKNLAISLVGRWDQHWSPTWDGGHVKFWSPQTLAQILVEERYVPDRFEGAGRFPFFWKSMMVTARPQ